MKLVCDATSVISSYLKKKGGKKKERHTTSIPPQPTPLTVVDARKNTHKLWSVCVTNLSSPLPQYTSRPCWWCRTPFDTLAYGCPMRFVPAKSHAYTSLQKLLKTKNVILPEDGYFETEGVFCSFKCMKAYAISEENICSFTLIKMLAKRMGVNDDTLVSAPDWRLLKDYGGHLTISEFRSSEGVVYVPSPNILRPHMIPRATLHQEHPR